MPENEKQKKRETRCPFDKTLECRDCRLFRTYIGGEGYRDCAIAIMAQRIG